MRVFRCASKEELAFNAARAGASFIGSALHERGQARIVLATGRSQEAMLDHLVRERLDWKRITAFHLDEYVGIRESHPASFRKYLKERILARVPLGKFHPIAGERNPVQECRRLNGILKELTIDVAFVGIGENGHLAFNDPPADFTADTPYRIVKLDRTCRRQQVKEGWFGTVAEVPTKAISMSIPQIMSAEHIICTVPDRRKARAVKAALEGEVTPDVPASILQEHPNASLFLDPTSAGLLEASTEPIVAEVARLEDCPLLRAPSQHFHLFVGGDFAKIDEAAKIRFARRAFQAGAVTLTAWGSGSGGLELIFDNESVVPGVRRGTPDTDGSEFISVSYKTDELEKALFYFLDSCSPAPEYQDTCNSWVVVLVGAVGQREWILNALADRGRFIDQYINQDVPSDPG